MTAIPVIRLGDALTTAMRASSLDGVPLTGLQLAVYLRACNPPAPTMARMAVDLGITASAISRAAGELTDRGLVHQVRLPHDKRRIDLRLTAYGERLRDKMFERIVATITQEEVQCSQ